MHKRIKFLGRIMLDALYPPACAICGKPLDRQKTPGLPPGVHDACFATTIPVTGSACVKCGKPSADDEVYCKDCIKADHTFTQSVAAFEVTPELQDALYRFKYKNKREYAPFFAHSIYLAHKDLLRFLQPELIIPTPMYYKKEHARGYNQAALIARELGKCLGIPVDTDLMERTKKTAPLKDCCAARRREILSGVFSLTKKLNARRVLVVDDIYTTGATLDACAAALKEGGAGEVYGAHVCVGAGI